MLIGHCTLQNCHIKVIFLLSIALLTQCLKITEKVSFNIASEAS